MAAKVVLGLDFETRSVVDIKKTGAYRYAEDPSTSVICLAYAFDDGPVGIWVPPAAPPSALLEAARDPRVIFSAFNVGFERRIWELVLFRRMGFPPVSLEKWHDTMADALCLALPGKLESVAAALGTQQQKSARGSYLIKMLCKPRKKGTTQFISKIQRPDLFDELYEYCMQDVRTEREVRNALWAHPTMDDPETRRRWLHTERINDRGVPIDVPLVHDLVALMEEKINRTDVWVAQLTEGRVESARQVAAIREEIEPVPETLDKVMVQTLLSDPLLLPVERELLEARVIASHSSTGKYERILGSLCSDDTVKDNLQFHGATTGRYAGRGLQIQNLPRKTHRDPDRVAAMLSDPDNDLDDIEAVFGDVMVMAATMIRPSIKAPQGSVIVCSDFSAVEARAVAWATMDEDQLEVFRSGRDNYRQAFADMYGIPYEDVPEEGEERQLGKVAVLLCGYQGAWKAVWESAGNYGLSLTPRRSNKLVQDFRRARPRMTAAWGAFDEVAILAVRTGERLQVPGVVSCYFGKYGRHLYLEFPNGRKMWFPFAEIRRVTTRYETPEGEIRQFTKDSVTHMVVDSLSKKWVRRSIHGGSLFQSYIQGLCFDLLMEGQLRLEEDGWNIIMSVHDEAAALQGDDPAWSLARFDRILQEVPTWAKGFPINSKGWRGERYRK